MSETDDVKRPWDHGADYYSTSDEVERMTHETLDECLEHELDGADGTIIEAVSKGVTVYAWRRDTLDIEDEATSALDGMMESVSIHILEEYGDPDGDSEDIFGAEAETEFKLMVMPFARALLSNVKPWRCHVIGERTFTPEELMEWVRKNNPKWLEGKT